MNAPRRPRRRGDQIATLFAMVHESACDAVLGLGAHRTLWRSEARLCGVWYRPARYQNQCCGSADQGSAARPEGFELESTAMAAAFYLSANQTLS